MRNGSGMNKTSWIVLLIIFCLAGNSPAQEGVCPELIGRWGYGLTFDVAADDEYIYVGNGTVLQIYGMEDPAHPALVSEIMLDGFIRQIAVSGWRAQARRAPAGGSGADRGDALRRQNITLHKYAFIAANRAGMVIVDVSDPTRPFVAGNFATSMVAWSVALKGNYAFVSESTETAVVGGLVHIVDVSDCGNVNEVQSIEIVNVRGLALLGDCLFAIGGYWGGNRTLDIIDIGDPASARIVSTLQTETSAEFLVEYSAGGREYVLYLRPFE